MELINYPVLPILLFVLVGLHALGIFLRGTASKIIFYLNILLHVLALPLLSYYGIVIEESVLFYMISIFAYTLLSLISYALIERIDEFRNCCDITRETSVDAEITAKTSDGEEAVSVTEWVDGADSEASESEGTV